MTVSRCILLSITTSSGLSGRMSKITSKFLIFPFPVMCEVKRMRQMGLCDQITCHKKTHLPMQSICLLLRTQPEHSKKLLERTWEVGLPFPERRGKNGPQRGTKLMSFGFLTPTLSTIWLRKKHRWLFYRIPIIRGLEGNCPQGCTACTD